MKPETGTYSWFALQTRSRYEHFAAAHLRSKGYELFLPVYTCRRRWSDRIKELELPLFPGYVFCKFDLLNRLPILVTPGVIQVIGTGKSPIPIDDAEIAALQAVAHPGDRACGCPFSRPTTSGMTQFMCQRSNIWDAS